MLDCIQPPLQMRDTLGNQERDCDEFQSDGQTTGNSEVVNAISCNCDQNKFWCSETICLGQLPNSLAEESS